MRYVTPARGQLSHILPSVDQTLTKLTKHLSTSCLGSAGRKTSRDILKGNLKLQYLHELDFFLSVVRTTKVETRRSTIKQEILR